MRILFHFLPAKFFLILTLFSTSMSSFAGGCSEISKNNLTPLLEVYTSEGCSSCQPADRWLSQLAVNKTLFDKVVPLAFHVDYWDGLGWKDPFANPVFTARQRHLDRLSGVIYTPQVFLGGIDFRGWTSTSHFLEALNGYSKTPAKARIAMSLNKNESGDDLLTLDVSDVKTSTLKNLDIYLAIYDSGLMSQVSAGENNGKALAHDYVVRQLLGPFKFDKNGVFHQMSNLKSEWRSRQVGAVSFVQDNLTNEIFQSLAFKFCS